MKKILLITDSLGAPRCKPAYVRDAEVWTYRLADSLHMDFNFRFFMVNGLDTNLLVNYCKESLDAYDPDIVILQVGIVDCCPRSLTKKELLISKNLPPFISRFIHKMVKKNRVKLINKRKVRYVSPQKFEENLNVIKAFFSKSKTIVLPIAPASKNYINYTPMIKESVVLYNKIKEKIFGQSLLSDLYRDADENQIFLLDEHHLNSHGHALVFEKLYRQLRTIL